MPGVNFWMIFQVFGIVSTWSVKALEDNKITLVEAAQLGLMLGTLLGIPTDVNIPTAEAVEIPLETDASEEVPDDANERAPPLTERPRPS